MICPKCGTQNVDQAIYCAKCGEKLQKDSKAATKNNNVMVLILAALLLMLILACLVVYMRPKLQGKNEPAATFPTSQADSVNSAGAGTDDVDTDTGNHADSGNNADSGDKNVSLEYYEITNQDLADTRWYMFAMFDMEGNEVDPCEIVDENAAEYYADNYLDFYSKDSYVEEEKFGMFLSFYTNGEGDGLLWGDYRCDGNLVYLGCDVHGDEITLEHMTLDYAGETIEVLKLTDEVSDKYGNAKTYQMYFRRDLEYDERLEEYSASTITPDNDSNDDSDDDDINYTGGYSEDYYSIQSPDDFELYSHSDYTIAYPKNFYQEGRFDDSAITLVGDNGSVLDYSFNSNSYGSIKDGYDAAYDFAEANFEITTPILEKREEGRLVLSGQSGGSDYYYLANITEDHIYTMMVTYLKAESEEEFLHQSYVVDCLYRYCSFNGSPDQEKHQPRQYDDFVESGEY